MNLYEGASFFTSTLKNIFSSQIFKCPNPTISINCIHWSFIKVFMNQYVFYNSYKLYKFWFPNWTAITIYRHIIYFILLYVVDDFIVTFNHSYFKGIDELDFAPSFSLHEAIQNRLDQFIDIKNLLPDIPRTTFSGYGSKL